MQCRGHVPTLVRHQHHLNSSSVAHAVGLLRNARCIIVAPFITLQSIRLNAKLALAAGPLPRLGAHGPSASITLPPRQPAAGPAGHEAAAAARRAACAIRLSVPLRLKLRQSRKMQKSNKRISMQGTSATAQSYAHRCAKSGPRRRHAARTAQRHAWDALRHECVRPEVEVENRRVWRGHSGMQAKCRV